VVTALTVAVPLPFATVQIWLGLEGCVSTVTAYASVGPITGVLNTKGPFVVIVRLSPPLFCKITLELAARPDTLPPIVAVTGFVVHATATVVTFAVAVPAPVLPVTAQVCAGLVGCVTTVTA